MRTAGDVDTFGQRLAAGGSVEFDAVPVAADCVLGSLSADEDVLSPLAALTSPVGRHLSAQLLLASRLADRLPPRIRIPSRDRDQGLRRPVANMAADHAESTAARAQTTSRAQPAPTSPWPRRPIRSTWTSQNTGSR